MTNQENQNADDAETGHIVQDPPKQEKQDKQEPAKEAVEAEQEGQEEPEQKDDPNAEVELDANVWGQTGDPVGDGVLKVLQRSGITPEKAKALLYDAAQAGDASKINEADLIAAVGETNATLIIAGVKGFISEQSKKAQEIVGTLYEVVGSKENWDTLVGWAKENLTETELDEYVALIDAGGRKARMAAADLRERYEEAGNTGLTAGKDTVVPQRRAKAVQEDLTPLSRKDYFEAVQKAHRENKATPERLNALYKQREAGKAKGI